MVKYEGSSEPILRNNARPLELVPLLILCPEVAKWLITLCSICSLVRKEPHLSVRDLVPASFLSLIYIFSSFICLPFGDQLDGRVIAGLRANTVVRFPGCWCRKTGREGWLVASSGNTQSLVWRPGVHPAQVLKEAGWRDTKGRGGGVLANEEKKACRDIGKNSLCRPFKIWCLCWRESCHPLWIKLLKTASTAIIYGEVSFASRKCQKPQWIWWMWSWNWQFLYYPLWQIRRYSGAIVCTCVGLKGWFCSSELQLSRRISFFPPSAFLWVIVPGGSKQNTTSE